MNDAAAAAAIRAMRAPRGPTAQRANQQDSPQAKVDRVNETLQAEAARHEGTRRMLSLSEPKTAHGFDDEERQFYLKILSGEHCPSRNDKPSPRPSRVVCWTGPEFHDDDSWLGSDSGPDSPKFPTDDVITKHDDDENDDIFEPDENVDVDSLEVAAAKPELPPVRATSHEEAVCQASPPTPDVAVCDSLKVLSDFSDSDDDDGPPESRDAADGGGYLSDDRHCVDDVHELGLAAKAPPVLRRRVREGAPNPTTIAEGTAVGPETTSTPTREPRVPKQLEPEVASDVERSLALDSPHHVRLVDDASTKPIHVARRLPSKGARLARATTTDFRVLDIAPGQRLRVRPNRRRSPLE